MNDAVEHQLSQALLEKIEPLLHMVEGQLQDLGQGQEILQGQVAQLSAQLSLSQAELDKAHDMFARLPHYIAKINAMKNIIASVHVQSRKLKRRADMVQLGREKQDARMQASRAKEQAYDQAVAAVQTPNPVVEGRVEHSSSLDVAGTLTTATTTKDTGRFPISLPFPLPAKPAFPIVSTRPSDTTQSPPPRSLKSSPLLLSSSPLDRGTPPGTPRRLDSPLGDSGSSIVGSSDGADREDRFPQVSALDDTSLLAASSEVEVVRLRRKKKGNASSRASSIASIGPQKTKPST